MRTVRIFPVNLGLREFMCLLRYIKKRMNKKQRSRSVDLAEIPTNIINVFEVFVIPSRQNA